MKKWNWLSFERRGILGSLAIIVPILIFIMLIALPKLLIWMGLVRRR